MQGDRESAVILMKNQLQIKKEQKFLQIKKKTNVKVVCIYTTTKTKQKSYLSSRRWFFIYGWNHIIRLWYLHIFLSCCKQELIFFNHFHRSISWSRKNERPVRNIYRNDYWQITGGIIISVYISEDVLWNVAPLKVRYI